MRPLGRSTGRADRQMTGPEEALLGAPLEDFKPRGAGQRRCRSGSMAVEPQPAGRQLGTGRRLAPSVPAGNQAERPLSQVFSAATQAVPAAGPVDLPAGPVVQSASRGRV